MKSSYFLHWHRGKCQQQHIQNIEYWWSLNYQSTLKLATYTLQFIFTIHPFRRALPFPGVNNRLTNPFFLAGKNTLGKSRFPLYISPCKCSMPFSFYDAELLFPISCSSSRVHTTSWQVGFLTADELPPTLLSLPLHCKHLCSSLPYSSPTSLFPTSGKISSLPRGWPWSPWLLKEHTNGELSVLEFGVFLL